jgi:hypothetical protein
MNEQQYLNEFMAEFPTEEDCIRFLYQLKWPSGFICPRCNHSQAYTIQTRRLPLYECACCRHQTSLTVNTVMEGSKTSLFKWLIALFLVSRPSSGISALQLSKKINVTYKTAWLMLHKIRHAMSEADASVKLCGFVQVSDVWTGHTHHSSYHRHPREYPLLMGATMNSETPVYLKIKTVSEDYVNDRCILSKGREAFTHENVESDGSTVEFVIGRAISTKYKKLSPLFKQMNRWIRSTFHRIRPRHLLAYLNEFCYRFNIHQQGNNIFEHLSRLCVNSRAISYAAFIG